MSFKSYLFRLKTASETFTEQNRKSNANHFLFYFQGERGSTQVLTVPLTKLTDETYENAIELLDVGNLSLAYVKLDAKNVRWKLSGLELERVEDRSISNFPINRWFDCKRSQKVNVLIKEGPVELAPIYTIIVHTGTVSTCTEASVQLALIGDGASTLPLDLSSNSTLLPCSAKNFFRSTYDDVFHISPSESNDVGQLFHLQLWCDSLDKLPYYCESIEVINNLTDDNYFFVVNHWFGPNLEQSISVPAIDRQKESNIFTISVKTINITDYQGENMMYIQMKFANGKSYEECLKLSETHQIPFKTNNIDFFLVTLDGIGKDEILTVQISFVNKSAETSKSVQWNCAWIQIRDIFYRQNYCYTIPKTMISTPFKNVTRDYISLERIVHLPCSNTREHYQLTRKVD